MLSLGEGRLDDFSREVGEVTDLAPALEVPDPDLAIGRVAAARGEELAVRFEGEVTHRPSVAAEGGQLQAKLLALLQRKQLDRAVVAGCRQVGAVVAESNGPHRFLVVCQLEDQFSGLQVPDVAGVAVAAGRQQRTVAAHGQRRRPVGRRQRLQCLAGGRVPNLDRGVAAGGEHALAVRAEDHGRNGGGVAGAGANQVAGRRVEHADLAVPARRGDELAVRAEGRVLHRAGAGPEAARLLPGRGVEQHDRPVRAGPGEAPAVRTEGRVEAKDGGMRRRRSGAGEVIPSLRRSVAVAAAAAPRSGIDLRTNDAAQVVPLPAPEIGPAGFEDAQGPVGAAGQVLALGGGDGIEVQARLGPIARLLGEVLLLRGAAGVVHGLLALHLGFGVRTRLLAPFPGDQTDRDVSNQEQDQQQRRDGRAAPHPHGSPLQPADATGADRLARQVAAQVLGELLGTSVASGRRLVQAFQTDRFQIARRSRPQARRRHRLHVHDQAHRLQRRIAPERRPAGEELVEHRAERVHVHRRADRVDLPFRLLRRHVRRRSQDGTRAAHVTARVHLLRQAEVGDLGLVSGEW